MPRHSIVNKLSFTLLLAVCSSSQASNTLLTKIQKSAQGAWTVEYKTNNPVERIVFNHSPNGSRVERWSSETGEFKIEYKDNFESIYRSDGKPFTQARFNLTPSYTHLPKSYAPFSPLSDGGMIFNSGRFFACIDTCDDQVDQWHLSLNVPPADHIILNGEVIKKSATWSDNESGKSIYVGSQKPVESGGTLSIIDKGLPSEIRQSLDKDIPIMMRYFEQTLGQLVAKDTPSLFASYSNRPGHSSQGGTLPGQVFMHWDFDDLDKKVGSSDFLNNTLLFFAHEVAHLFQSNTAFSENNTEAWVHEGSADLFAFDALQELYPQTKNYVESKKAESKLRCIEGLKSVSLTEASSKGKFLMHYHCGLLIHQRIQKQLSENNSETTNQSLWMEYRERVLGGKPAGQQTFLNVVELHTTAELRAHLEAFIITQHKDPEKAVEAL